MTLIKKYLASEDDLTRYLSTRFPAGHQAEKLKTIIRVGYLNDLLSEPKGNKNSQNLDSYISWLESKYINAYKNRTMHRIGNPMQTVPDLVVDIILMTKFNYSNEQVKLISQQHRLSMLAENLVGNLLEDFLEITLSRLGWVCCYGETLKYSDFCHGDNFILQVKNRDNTENSSSSKIRDNNPRIRMWFRTYSQTDKTNWESLLTLLRITPDLNIELNENAFHEFVKNILEKNPRIISEN
jgi:hypothetical protein